MNRDLVIENAKKILLQELDLYAIVLFGSYARGKERETSDIDIAIKSNKNIEQKELLDVKNKIERAIGLDVHLIDLDKINEDFKYEILMSGKDLYTKDEYKFTMYKLRMYSD